MPQHDLMQVIVPGWASFPPIRKWIDNLWNYPLWPLCCCSVVKSCPTLCDPMNRSSQASLSITISQSLLRFMSIVSVMLSNYLILCHSLHLLPQSFPASGSFPRSQLFKSGGQSIGAPASASVLAVNIQGWFPLGLTGLNFSTDVLFQLGLTLY